MAEIPGIVVVEPSGLGSKWRTGSVFLRKGSPPRLDSIKAHLKELRESTRSNHSTLLEQLKRTLEQYSNFNLLYAENAKKAASQIMRIAGNTNIASINKSSVVVNELRPELKPLGLKTNLRYFTEFNNFDVESFKRRVEDYWSVPDIHSKGLVESFEVQKQYRRLNMAGLRDYIAILGVNAISAEDGTVFFLQHMSNISKDIDQSKKLILVVSVEKILKDREAALFHTRAMGIFGLESILLSLAPNLSEIYDFEQLPVLSAPEGREIHLIILDNGRTQLLNEGYSDLFLCIDCRACTRQCPIGERLLVDRGMIYSPKNYVLAFLQGAVPPLDECLHCDRCEVECPISIDIPTFIWKTQIEYNKKFGRSLKKRVLDNPELMAKMGKWTAPVSNWVKNLSIARWIMESFADIHRDAKLPTFHRRTFREWFKRGTREG
jgi:L-lactate utilization protein LutB